MGILKIQKKNKQNNNTYFNQDAMANNQYGAYDNQGMYNQGMMQQQGMYNQNMPQQGMYNQGMMQQQAPAQMNYNQAPNMPQMARPNMGNPNQGMMQPAMAPQGNIQNRPMPQQGNPNQGVIQPNPNRNQGVVQPNANRGMVDLPKVEEPEELEELDMEQALPRETEALESLDESTVEKHEKLNPLDNDKNPIPVNPIIEQIESHQNVEEIGESREVKANLFSAFGIILGMVVRPGTTMLNNAKKYKKVDKAISIMLWLAFIFLILCIGIRLLVGSFDRTYSSLTDSYKLVFNPARIMQLNNYVMYIIIAVALSIGGVLLVALIYYASSFLNSKGVHFSTYLIVSNLGMIPLIFGTVVLYPIGMIFNVYLGIGVLIFTFLATVITLLIGMNEVLTFKSLNNQIFYHVINLSIITLIALIAFIFMVHHSWIILPQIVV